MSTKPPSGTRDFLPRELRRRQHVMGVVRDVYERYGFEPLETPAFENIETLLGKYGDEGNKLIFKILRRGEHEASGTADLALRYDLTVPLARVVAQYQNELPRFFKRYQMQPVWRADRPARGRFREFYQCDIDAVGTTSPMVEAELVTAVCEVLTRLGFEDFEIRLNHRLALSAVLRTAGVAMAQQGEALVLDKWDKIGRDGVAAELAARGIETRVSEACLGFFERTGKTRFLAERAAAQGQDANRAILGEVRAFAGLDPEGAAAAGNLETIVGLLDQAGAGARVRIDPSLARGLSYYTGAIMEAAVPDLAGSLGGGGRYDGLIGMFLGRDVPACGFALGLERIIVVMTERGMFPEDVERAPVDVMLTCMSDALRLDVLRLAARLRADGLRVDVFPEAGRKLDKALKYAGSRHVPCLAILGEDEQVRGDVTVRDLTSREQVSLEQSKAAAWIAARRPA
jgi:histidyl-tRNA synthetase